MQQATVRDLETRGKRVLVRVDYNVPLEETRVTDDTRIVASLPTLRHLLEQNAAVVLMSHLGRPKGKVNPKYSLKPAAERLAELLGRPVKMAPDCVGPEALAMKAALAPGEVLLLENLRFHPEEEANDRDFARQLSEGCEQYVNDAFGAAHRAHASTAAVAEFLPAVAGFLMERELTELGNLLTQPERPFVAILGGAKVADKIAGLESLVEKADTILIGGGMSFTFLKARGKEIGRSLLDDVHQAEKVEQAARARGTEILLPVDVVVAPEIKEGVPTRIVSVDEIPADLMGLDIGPETARLFADKIKSARTIFWNGPQGVFETPPFDIGTRAVATAVAESAGRSCVGGGDSVAAITSMNLAEKVTHVSTGGGASLEFLEGRDLPGVTALKTSAALGGR
ncbi:phosphoglycerate kinase [bacterium CPR1]|nr:phosphoglycerate kinase [bacterium CPR1]